MTTRREIIKGGVCLAAILTAGRSPAVLRKSMIAARQTLLGRGGSELPYDAEVEYLESTGTQYIDTGITFNAPCTFDFDYYGLVTNIFGYNMSREIIIRSYPSWYFLTYYSPSGGDTFPKNQRANVHGVLNASGSSLSLNGNIVAENNLVPYDGRPMYLFSLAKANGMDYTMVRFYRFTATSGGKTVDFIPVRFTNELGQSEGAMYDKVSGQLFRNQGTGAFVVGPDKTAWVNPYVTDGLVAMWDGEWNAGGGVHDANATTWVDLVGGYDAQASTYGGTFSFTANSCEIGFQGNTAAGSGVLVAEMGAIGSSVLQIENVYSRTGTDAAAALCLCGVGNRQFLCANESGVLGMYGYTQYGATNLSSNDFHSYSISLTGGWPILSAAYADGTPLDISGYKQAMTQAQTYSEGRMFIGYRAFSQNPTVSIKNIRLYNRVLTAAEIAANYAVDKARFNLP